MRMPRLSFIVPTNSFATIADVTERLASQSIAEEIEIVAVCPAAADLNGYERVGAVRLTVVEHPLLPLGEAHYVADRGRAEAQMLEYELHKAQYLNDSA